MRLDTMLGVAGVSSTEGRKVLRVASVLNYFVLCALVFMVVDLFLYLNDSPLNLPELNIVVWLIFVVEFLMLTFLVKDKRRYVSENWLNVILIALAFPWLTWLDSEYVLMLRSLRLLLFIRFFGSFLRTSSKLLSKNRFGQILLGFAFLVLGAGGVFSYIEQRPLEEGIWYALVTITTVGYGDVVPLSEAGRYFGSILIVFGVLFFSLVTANFSAFLVGSEQKMLEKDTLRTVRQIEKHLALQSNESEKNTEKLIMALSQEIDELKKEVDLLKKDKID
jgi:voltage-gated potassium channel